MVPLILFHLILTSMLYKQLSACTLLLCDGREINLCLHDSKPGQKVTMVTRLSWNQKQDKRSVLFLDVF